MSIWFKYKCDGLPIAFFFRSFSLYFIIQAYSRSTVFFPQLLFHRSPWQEGSVIRTRTELRRNGKSRARHSVACRSVSWRNASTGRNTWRPRSARRSPKPSKWQMLRSKPGSRTGEQNGGALKNCINNLVTCIFCGHIIKKNVKLHF